MAELLFPALGLDKNVSPANEITLRAAGYSRWAAQNCSDERNKNTATRTIL